ncbi:MAG: uracil-DNA glycosylase family protein, partial [Caldilineaceae bacterium]
MNPIEQGCKCSECPYAKDGKPIGFVTVSAPKNPVALLVADMPNARDAEEGSFLSGPTGERFDQAMAEANLRPDDCATVFAVQCKPKEPRRKEETKAARLACAPGLAAVMKQYGNLPTLVMGSVAMASLGKKGALTGKKSVRGFIDGNRIYTLAPAYAAWADPYAWGAFLEDVKRLGRMVRGQMERYPTLITRADHHDLAALVDSARRHGMTLTVDLETKPARRDEPWTGKDPTRAKLHQVGFGIEDFGISIFWENASGETKRAVRQVMADATLTKVFHNGPWFDVRVLDRHGIPTNVWEDTRDMRRATSSTSKLSLAFLGSISTDIHAWKG